MTSEQLVGEVAASYLSRQVPVSDVAQRSGSTARFIVDCLHRGQVAAIARAILRRPELKECFEVKLPEQFLQGAGLPPEYLTQERATYYRHANCYKPALLVANIGDDEQQSLRELLPVGERQLRERPSLWVNLSSKGIHIGDTDAKVWEQALAALSDLGVGSLDELARYTLRVRRHIEQDDQPLLSSLGMALPVLKMPKNPTVFYGIAQNKRSHKWTWRQKIRTILTKQAPLLRKQHASGRTLTELELRSSFGKVKDTIPDELHPVIEAFISAPEGWNEEAKALAELKWNDIRPLFDGLRTTRKFDFRRATREFYEERGPELLSDEEREYVKLLELSRKTTADEEDEEFFDNHRRELAQEHKLYTAWERFVYRSPIETKDFVKGIALALEAIVAEGPNEVGQIVISTDRRTQLDYQSLNKEAGRYFTFRYRGLEKLFAPHVKWEVGELFRYSVLEKDWNRKKKRYGDSKSRAALQIKFEVRVKRGESEARKRLVWRFDRNSVSAQLPSDWERVVGSPLARCGASIETVRAKGSSGQVDLQDRGTLVAAYGQQRGTLVPKKSQDIGVEWRRNVGFALRERVLEPKAKQKLSDLFSAFEESYAAAVNGFLESGLACADLERQAEDYGRLLEHTCHHAQGDRNRELLLKPMMHIGVGQIDGEFSVAIVAPWQPLRLVAMARKAQIVAELIAKICGGGDIRFGDRRQYFRNLADVLGSPFYPEVVAGWQGGTAEVFSLFDVAADYTLHGQPTARRDEKDGLEEDAKGAATQVVDLVNRFLKLYPHERADLSVALFNPLTVRTPRAVAEKVQSALEGEQRLRCRLILVHNDRKRLARIYQDLVGGSEQEDFLVSDSSRDFMSWLSIEVRSGLRPEEGVRPVDILFTQDAVSRHASLKWRAQVSEPLAAESLVPLHWSRRCPAQRGMLRSAVYLCCPEQTREGWAYIGALASLVRGERGLSGKQRLLPVVELNFQDQQTKGIIDDTHGLASWVANYDRLLDRSHLESQNVKIIRWKQAAAQGRSLLVSSNAETPLLKTLVTQRLQRLGLSFALDQKRLRALADRMIAHANEISGDILMRAAKRGRSASELIGLVLSRFEVQCQLGVERTVGWYFLDDYSAWLGQREAQIADILALCPHVGDDGVWELDVVVSEAKYVQASSLAAKRKESRRQLLQTMDRLRDALDEESPRIDRGLWLARFSDLLLDRVFDPVDREHDSAKLRRAIRGGRCNIRLAGFSHVFVYGPADAGDCGERVAIGDLDNAQQVVYAPGAVRALVEKYEAGALPAARIRQKQDAGVDDDAEESHANGKKSRGTVPAGLTTGIGSESGTESLQPNDKKRRASLPEPVVGSSAFAHLVASMTAGAQEEDDGKDLEWLKGTSLTLRKALNDYGLTSKVVRSRLTPNAALLDFRGSAFLTVAKVRNRQSELLTTHGLEVVSVLPKPGIVSIAIARPSRALIRMQDLWLQWHPQLDAGNEELLIGVREDDGNLQLLSPGGRHSPHTLIAGSTGSGKSVLMQNMLLAIAATNTPDQAHITLIDPKHGVDYFAFEDLPHLKGGLIVTQDEALERINALVEEMDRRYGLLRQAKAANLRIYNRKVAHKARLPVLWLVHDEFAEWMLTESYKKNVTSAVARLGVKARAAGIHLVFASQRPDAHVMPPQLRDNLGNRLILRVNSEGTSELALGEKGAERLLGRGHLLARLEDENMSVYVQVPFVEPEFIEMAVSIIADRFGRAPPRVAGATTAL